MLSYRHLFHAGNFADVFKHALLAQLLVALHKKQTPFCYLDTHAGTALYDLGHAWAQKAREHEQGIALMWQREDAPAALAPYLDLVRRDNPDGRLRWYPGSPRIARALLRGQDRMVLSELNVEDCAKLEAVFASDAQTTVRHMDGYDALKMYVPPREKRGLVLIDSGFDQREEFARLVQALRLAYARWDTGMYALWYPLMHRGVMRRFERLVAESGVRKIMRAELALHPETWTMTMRGCGMLIVNPPWQFEQTMRPVLKWLWEALSPAREGGVHLDWLVPETPQKTVRTPQRANTRVR
jgi:23S rRNA (adenine2030-N6)-methyltransferase